MLFRSEVREILASLGLRSIDEAVGRSDLLDVSQAILHWKAQGLDLAPILHRPELPAGTPLRHMTAQDHGLDGALDNSLIEICRPAIDSGEPVRAQLPIANVNRTVGTMLGAEVTRAWGGQGLPEGTIDLLFIGSAGQSFGAFLAPGITLYLIGDANDYTGKGLSGGRVVVRPSLDFRGVATENIIVGNTVMYGATSGEA